jgi:hypothetical protein
MKMYSKCLCKGLLTAVKSGDPMRDQDGKEIGKVVAVGLDKDDPNYVVITTEITDLMAAEKLKQGRFCNYSIGHTVDIVEGKMEGLKK